MDAHFHADEGHRLFKRENQIGPLRRTVDWLDKYLKGQAIAPRTQIRVRLESPRHGLGPTSWRLLCKPARVSFQEPALTPVGRLGTDDLQR